MPAVPLHVGTFTPSLLVDVARTTGRLERVGLEVIETAVTSSPAQFRALESGELDVVMTSPDNVLAYRFLPDNPLGRNLPVQVIAAIDRGLGLSLCVGPAIEDVDAVRGRVVGVDVPESGFAFVAFALLERAGLGADDYVVRALGSTPRRAVALVEGDCAATVLNAGNELRAVAAGCRSVAAVTDLGPYLGTVLAALATSDERVVDRRHRLAGALLETAREVVAGERRAEVTEAATRLLGLGPREAAAHHECLRDPHRGLVPDGRVDPAAIDTLLELRRGHGSASGLDHVRASWTSVLTGPARGADGSG